MNRLDRLSRITWLVGRLAFAVCLLSPITACQSLPKDDRRAQAEKHWNQVRARVKCQLAQKQFAGGRTEEAQRAAMECVALDPTLSDAYVVLARAYLEQAKPSSAMKTLEAARTAGVGSAELLYTEGVILEQRGRLDAALEKYAEARRQDGANVDYLVAEAECLVALDQADEALKRLAEQGDETDDAATLALLTGRIAALTDDKSAAPVFNRSDGAADFAAAPPNDLAAMLSGNPELAETLGLHLSHVGRHAEAVSILAPRVENQANGRCTLAARHALAESYLSLNDFASARRTIEDHAQSCPDDPTAQILLAQAALGQADLATALFAARRARESNSSNLAASLILAVVYWRRGEYSEAAALTDEILRAHPDDADAHCLMAELFIAQQDGVAARARFAGVLQRDPTNPWAAAGIKSLSP